MTSKNETVSRQNLWVGNIAKSMTSEGNSVLLPANVDQRSHYSEVQWISSLNIFSYITNRNFFFRNWGSRETKLTVSLGTSLSSHWVFNMICLTITKPSNIFQPQEILLFTWKILSRILSLIGEKFKLPELLTMIVVAINLIRIISGAHD